MHKKSSSFEVNRLALQADSAQITLQYCQNPLCQSLSKLRVDCSSHVVGSKF